MTGNSDAAAYRRAGVGEWARRFVSLSRLPHVLLDIATPAMAALLWLGRFPSPRIVFLGLLASFAGYAAVYALNDLVDRRIDREKMATDDTTHRGYLDAVAGRHPVALGVLKAAHGWAWVATWEALAIVAAFLLRPVCVLVFLSGAALEALYCRLYRVTPLRLLLSGAIKTFGGIAAVFAVDPNPDLARLLLLMSMVFFWEIGGQNIPADWTDIDEDRAMRARTTPVFLGARRATLAIIASLGAAICMSAAVLTVFGGAYTLVFIACAVLAGSALLLFPSLKLLRTGERLSAQGLFNVASWYPLSLLAIAAARAIV
ncbi:MAG: UbiA family prenyltransferase [Spirochaetia bacterium]